MDKDSVIIRKLISFFKLINEFYEYSMTYNILNKIGNVCLNSFTIRNLYKGLTLSPHNNYAEGSFLISFIFKGFTNILSLLKKLYLVLAKLNSKSINRNIFNKIINPLVSLEKGLSALFSIFFGIFFIRTIGALIIGISPTLIILNFILCIIFLLLTFLNYNIFIKAIKGCLPSRMLAWLYKE